jgi:hypothetical protein
MASDTALQTRLPDRSKARTGAQVCVRAFALEDPEIWQTEVIAEVSDHGVSLREACQILPCCMVTHI